jgi:glycosyltransferase involved in cell wall biosynthesis
MSEVTVTVVLSNYNHGRFLRAALDGILLQSRPADEVIVIDDASTDDSVEILRSYERRFPALRVLVNERNRGVIANGQTLLGLARGRYYYAAAADDMLLPGFFEKSLAILEQNPEAGLCSTLTTIMDECGREVGTLSGNPFPDCDRAHFSAPAEVRARLFRVGSWMQGNTVIFRREALLGAGGFRPELRSYTDGFVHEVIALRHGVCFVPEYLAAWRKMPEAFSAQTSVNPAAVLGIRREALRCMREEYGELFSPGYIRRWRNRWDAGALQTYARIHCREQHDALRQLLTPDTLPRRFMMGIGQLFVRGGPVLAWVAAAGLRWFDLPRLVADRLGRWGGGPRVARS